MRRFLYRSGSFVGILEMCISKEAGEKVREPIECPECRRASSVIERDITTLCGVIKRARCALGHTYVPWDEAKVAWTIHASCGRSYAWQCVLTLEKPICVRGVIDVSHTTLQKKVGEWSETLCVLTAPKTSAVSTRTHLMGGTCIYKDYPQHGSCDTECQNINL